MKRQNFTLIELLTVIAIIGVLTAILIPSIGKARATAQRTTCVNNYKQTALSVMSFRADHRGQMPCASGNHQVPGNPRGKSNVYCIDWTKGIPIGVLDYAYINSFKITDGPNEEGYCTISSATKNNGDVWLCPNTLLALKRTNKSERAGIFLAIHPRFPDSRTRYCYDFFSSDTSAPTRIPTNVPVSLSLCPMMAEMCANTCMLGGDDEQKGYRTGNGYIPAPHDNSYVVSWMDGHVEVCQAETTRDQKQKRFLNWQPYDENDKYYAPYGDRSQP